MTLVRCFCIALFFVAHLTLVHADTLTLRNGKKYQGTYLGGTARQVEFQPNSGQLLRVSIDEVASLSVSPPPVAAAPSKRPSVTIPAGTAFRVRTAELIDVDAAQAGQTFRGTLDDPIMSGGSVVVPRGADVVLVAAKVEQGGKIKGSDLVQLKVNFITVNGRRLPVVTSMSETKSAGEGKKSTRKILGGTGLGAIIGGIAGGGTGAAIGAVSGAAAGTIISASGEPHLKVPPETRLEFQFLADWKVP